MHLAGKLAAYRVALAAGLLAAGLSLGCLLDLPSVCGDGVVDLESGEQCDPAASNDPLCDPVSCTLVVAPSCGNGKIDAQGEQCDLSDFGNKTCPSGNGYLSCTDDCKLDESTCDQCGDGQVDSEVGEECDPKADYMGFKQPQACAELTTYPNKPYTSGQTTQCLPDKCVWYRGPCGFCGDNKADDPQILDINFPDRLSPRESCDGKDVQLEDLTSYCQDRGCPNSICAVKCLDTCDGFVEEAEARCCQPAGSDCPSPGQDPCCSAYDNGLDNLYAPEACVTKSFPGMFEKRVCASSK